MTGLAQELPKTNVSESQKECILELSKFMNYIFIGIVFASIGCAQAQVTWNASPLPKDGTLHSIAFGSQKFVGTLKGSPNDNNTGSPINSLPPKSLAVAGVATSTDGVSWSLIPVPFLAGSVASSGGSHFLATAVGDGEYLKVYSSTNGLDWTGVDFFNKLPDPLRGPHYKCITSISFSGGRYIVSGYTETSGDASFSYSSGPDFSTWTIGGLPDLNGFGSDFHVPVAYGKNRFVCSSDFYFYSAAPPAEFSPWEWTKRNVSPTSRINQIRFLNSQFIAVGLGVVYTSTDGIKWVKRTIPLKANYHSVSYGASTYVVAGDGGAIITSSDNGVTWKASASGVWSTFEGGAFGNGFFLQVGARDTVLKSR